MQIYLKKKYYHIKMGLIIKEIGLLGSKNSYKKLKALFDTGATRNYISKEFSNKETIDDIGVVTFRDKGPVIFPDGNEKEGEIINLKLLKIDGVPIENPEFFLFDMKMYDVIIGAKLMQELKIILNPSIKQISFGQITAYAYYFVIFVKLTVKDTEFMSFLSYILQ